MSACGGSPREATRPAERATETKPPPPATGKLAELETPPKQKLIDVDWNTTQLASPADALALWRRIAPTGADWEAKLDEIPDEGPIASQLALALLVGGNFTCVPAQPARDCSARPQIDIDSPAPASTFDDACLRRMLALWALEALDESDVDAAYDALKAIAAIPPPESQLIASVLDVVPVADQDRRLELRAIATRAGHREIVNGGLSDLDDAHMVAAVEQHIDGALDGLTVETHRPVFLAALGDEALHGPARVNAIGELLASVDGRLPRDLQAVLAKASKSGDCTVAAAASRALVLRGQRKLAPARPHARVAAPMMRSLCVLASFESLQGADEASYLLGYVPPKGLEVVRVTYDPYNERDTDGDGDPHTERSVETVRRNEVVLPELEEMIRAFRQCDGTTCKTDSYEFKFGFKPGAGGELMLSRIEVVERPPCTRSP